MTQSETRPPALNAVHLRGRVCSAPLERELPSGDTILTLRLVVGRERTPMTAKSRQTSDWVDCVAWGARPRRTMSRWCVGDIVELEGALRRRFFRTGPATSTRVEVEVLTARTIARA
jgi:single-strand DNA-binding protein